MNNNHPENIREQANPAGSPVSDVHQAGEDMRIVGVPARIYLNFGDLCETGDVPFGSLTDVTWCEDQINGTDIEYVRAVPAAPELAAWPEMTPDYARGHCDGWNKCLELLADPAETIEQLAARATEPQWMTKLRRELLMSKATHNFTFSRDEVMQLLAGGAPPAAAAVKLLESMPGASQQEAVEHARDMVKGHYPSHREYKVAKAYLDLLDRNRIPVNPGEVISVSIGEAGQETTLTANGRTYTTRQP